MECWFSKIPCIACWEWWDIAVASISALTAWFTTKFFLGKKIDENVNEIKARYTIDDLKFVEDYMDWWEENQKPDDDVEFIDKKWSDAKKLFDAQTLIGKHVDWFSSVNDMPRETRASIISSQASESIDLIRKHGYKKALEIRKRELVTPKKQ